LDSQKRNSDLKQIEVAESQSLSPQARIGQLSVGQPLNALEAIAATWVILKEAGEEYWITDRWVNQMINKCYYQQYEGHWATLQCLLQSSTNFQEYEDNLKSIISDRTYYGNFLPLTRRFQRSLRLLAPKEVQRRSKRNKSRRRGYRDKGSRAPDYVRYRRTIPAGAYQEISKLDLREEVLHPLLAAKTKTRGRDSPQEHVTVLLKRLRSLTEQRKELLSHERQINGENIQVDGIEGNSEAEEVETRSQEKPSEKSCVQKDSSGNRDQRYSSFPEKGPSQELQGVTRSNQFK
jgi:hypothetical protein